MVKRARNGPATGFDTAADFIPFELTDDDNDNRNDNGNDGGLGTDMDNSRRPHLAGARATAATAPAGPSASVNGHPQKRKRNDVDISHEPAPSSQRRRLDGPGGDDVNPWQASRDAYAHQETAKMYLALCTTCFVLMHL
jgi:hypothetical protein